MRLFLLFSAFVLSTSVIAQVGINSSTPTSTLDVNGSASLNIRAVTSGVVEETDFTVLARGPVEVPAPNSENEGRVYKIVNDTNGNIDVTIPNFRENGIVTLLLIYTLNNTPLGKGFTIQSDGEFWYLIDRF